VRPATVTLFFAVLALVALAFAILTFGAWLLRTRIPGLWQGLVDRVGPAGMVVATGVAAVATGGSLYLSEVAHFPPCRFCWYQRIGMYPILFIAGLAALRRDRRAWPYPLLLALLTLPLSIYHVLLERYPSLETSACDIANPCSVVWVKHFAFVTTPFMAGCGFLAIAASMVLVRASIRARDVQEAPSVES